MGRMKLWGGKYMPYVEREEWGANEQLTHDWWYMMEIPITFVRFFYEDLFAKHNTQEHIQAMQDDQRLHMEVEGQGDIRYNFMVNREGVVYEGTGWFETSPRPEKYADLKYKCLDILYLGDYSKEDPPYSMVRAGMHLIMYGLKELFISPNFKILPFRD